MSDELDPTLTTVAMCGWQLDLLNINFHMQCNFNFQIIPYEIVPWPYWEWGNRLLIGGCELTCSPFLPCAARSRENSFPYSPLSHFFQIPPPPPQVEILHAGMVQGARVYMGTVLKMKISSWSILMLATWAWPMQVKSPQWAVGLKSGTQWLNTLLPAIWAGSGYSCGPVLLLLCATAHGLLAFIYYE